MRTQVPGVPVKDYIAQSTEFLICIFALLAVCVRSPARGALRAHAAAAALLALPVPRQHPAGLDRPHRAGRDPAAAAHPRLPAVRLEGSGARLHRRRAGHGAGVDRVAVPARARRSQHRRKCSPIRRPTSVTSTGIRLELWKKSLGFVAAAPVIGHGTGSIPDQYRRAATGEGVTAIAANNPHNQIFAVAIQLGMLGVAILMTMWVAHLALFRGARAGFLDRPRDRDAEHRLVAVQFAPVRLRSTAGSTCSASACVGGMALREPSMRGAREPRRHDEACPRRAFWSSRCGGSATCCSTTPLIRSLKRAWPDAAIDALVFAGTEGILAGNPDLDDVVTMPARPSAGESARAAAQAVAPLRSRALDPERRPADLLRLGGRPPQRRASSMPTGSTARVKRRALDDRGADRAGAASRARGAAPRARRSASRRSPRSCAPHGATRRGIAPTRPYAVIHAAPMFRYKRWTERGLARARGRRLPRAGFAVVATGGPEASERAISTRSGRRAPEVARLDGALSWPRACRAARAARGLCRARHVGDASRGRDRRADRRALRADRSAPVGPVAGRRPRSALGCGRHDPARAAMSGWCRTRCPACRASRRAACAASTATASVSMN